MTAVTAFTIFHAIPKQETILTVFEDAMARIYNNYNTKQADILESSVVGVLSNILGISQVGYHS